MKFSVEKGPAHRKPTTDPDTFVKTPEIEVPLQGADPDMEPFSREFLEKIGIYPSLPSRPLSRTAKLLYAAVLSCGAVYEQPASSQHAPRSQGQNQAQVAASPRRMDVRSVRVERVEEQGPQIQVSGFAAVGLDDARHARGLVELMHPFLHADEGYRLRFSSHQRYINQVYFGLEAAAADVNERYEVLGDCAHREGAEEDVVTIYPAGVRPDNDEGYSRTDVLVDVEIHELLHTRSEEELRYFITRVQSAQRIKFPYPELFLRTRGAGRAVLWSEMANEYRSELVRALGKIKEILPGETIEDAAVRYIRAHFPGSSETAIREDVREIIRRNPGLNFPEFLKRSQVFRHETAIESARSAIVRDWINPIQDPELEAALFRIVDQPTPTEVQAIRHQRITGYSDRRVTPEEMRLQRNLTQYRTSLEEQSMTRHQAALRQLGMTAESPLFESWLLTVSAMRNFSAYRLGLSPDTRRTNEGVVYQDEDWDWLIDGIVASAEYRNFAKIYRSLTEEQRTVIRPLLLELLPINANAYALPPLLHAQAEACFGKRQPAPHS